MRAVALLALLVMAACQGAGQTSLTRTGPSPSLSSPETASPTTAASPARTASPIAGPPPSVTVTPAGKSLACRLPITWDVDIYANTAFTEVGFLTFPTGSVTEDHSVPFGFHFYDRAYSKWLPVLRQAVSPDGRHYAYTDGNPMVGATKGKVHVVDVASGVDRVVYTGAPVFWVLDFAPEGIYLAQSHGDVPTTGLWLENPAGGTPRLISRSIYGPVIAGRAAFGLAFNPADPHPAPGGKVGPFNQLTRLDLVTGTSTSLFYRPGANVDPLGADQNGDLMVRVFPGSSPAPEEVWLITPAAAALKLATFTTDGPGGIVAIDRHGIWLTGQQVWLYAGGAFRKVAAGPFNVAGGCIP